MTRADEQWVDALCDSVRAEHALRQSIAEMQSRAADAARRRCIDDRWRLALKISRKRRRDHA